MSQKYYMKFCINLLHRGNDFLNSFIIRDVSLLKPGNSYFFSSSASDSITIGLLSIATKFCSIKTNFNVVQKILNYNLNFKIKMKQRSIDNSYLTYT